MNYELFKPKYFCYYIYLHKGNLLHVYLLTVKFFFSGDESERCFTTEQLLRRLRVLTLAIVVFCSCFFYNKLNMQQEIKQKWQAVLATWCCPLLIQSVSHVCMFTASVLYYYLYKRTAEYLGDPRLYEDSQWLREVFAHSRYWSHFTAAHGATSLA